MYIDKFRFLYIYTHIVVYIEHLVFDSIAFGGKQKVFVCGDGIGDRGG